MELYPLEKPKDDSTNVNRADRVLIDGQKYRDAALRALDSAISGDEMKNPYGQAMRPLVDHKKQKKELADALRILYAQAAKDTL